MNVQLPDGIMDLARRYSSRKLSALLAFIYLVSQGMVPEKAQAGLGMLVGLYIVAQATVEIAETIWGQNGQEGVTDERPKQNPNGA